MEATKLLPPSSVENRLLHRLLQACVREKLLPSSFKENSLLISLTQNKKMIVLNGVRRFALDKFDYDGDILLISDNQTALLKNTSLFLSLLYQEIKEDIALNQWEKFAKEIENCAANDALSEECHEKFNQELILAIKKTSCNNLIEYLQSYFSAHEQFFFFERWATQGHPYHPCYKTKLGFDTKEYLTYSSEFNQEFPLAVAAISMSYLHLESEDNTFDYRRWFSEQFPMQWKAWLEKMGTLSSTNYLPIFIHPWQYQHVIKNVFSDLIESNHFILFQDIFIVTKPSLSFRTLMSCELPHQPHLKVPVAVQSTSTIRTLSPAHIQNGPKIVKILREIFKNEYHFNHSIKLLNDICGLHIKGYPDDIAKQLSILYRQNPASLLESNKHFPMLVAAFFEISPYTHQPLLIELLASTTDLTIESVKRFFDDYCGIVLQALLDLYLLYGIALEGHQQNTLVVFESNRPCHLLIRDLGGIRIHIPTLNKRGYDFAAYPHSPIVCHDITEARNKFLHATIQCHLGEMVTLLSKHFHTTELPFWKIVKENIEIRFMALRHRLDKDQWEQEYRAILCDNWRAKGLMRMRLNNVDSDYIFVQFKNPLRDI